MSILTRAFADAAQAKINEAIEKDFDTILIIGLIDGRVQFDYSAGSAEEYALLAKGADAARIKLNG